jgi:hypothetical protein
MNSSTEQLTASVISRGDDATATVTRMIGGATPAEATSAGEDRPSGSRVATLW